MSLLSVMLVDDHAVVRAGYRLLLEQSGGIRIVAEAARGEEACGLYTQSQPDVVVLDINMPGIGGLATIQRLCGKDDKARILVFSVHDEPLYVSRALSAGARGYVVKSSAAEIMMEAVKRVAKGDIYVDPSIASIMTQQTFSQNDSAMELKQLTPREFDVFCLLAQGRTTREVAEELCLSVKTVSNYMVFIKQKLALNTTADMALLAIRNGILKPEVS